MKIKFNFFIAGTEIFFLQKETKYILQTYNRIKYKHTKNT